MLAPDCHYSIFKQIKTSRNLTLFTCFAKLATVYGKILLLFHQKTALCSMSIFFYVMKKEPRLDQTQKQCVSEIPFQNPFEAGDQLNAGTLSQSASSNHAFLIIRSALVIKKNAICLSQAAFSNFAPYVIKGVIGRVNSKSAKRAARGRFEIKSTITRNCTTRSPITN